MHNRYIFRGDKKNRTAAENEGVSWVSKAEVQNFSATWATVNHIKFEKTNHTQFATCEGLQEL